MPAGVDCCGGVPFTDDDELESALAFGGIGPSSSSSSITIGELRDPMPTMAMTGEFERRGECLSGRGIKLPLLLHYVISVVINGGHSLNRSLLDKESKSIVTWIDLIQFLLFVE
jgi:hypothetical protein